MHIFLQFLTMIEKSFIFYVIYLNHVHNLKSVIFQEVLHILYFKIIPTISQKIDSNFGGQNWLIPYIVQSLITEYSFRHCPCNLTIRFICSSDVS